MAYNTQVIAILLNLVLEIYADILNDAFSKSRLPSNYLAHHFAVLQLFGPNTA